MSTPLFPYSAPFYTSIRMLATCSRSFPPGLVFLSRFLEESQRTPVQARAKELYRKIISQQQTAPTQEARSYLSKYHNLKSKEYYKAVHFEDQDGRKISCQYFQKYGEEGHQLSYFIGNNNIPRFIQTDLITRMLDIPEVRNLKEADKGIWNFTFNTYALLENASKLATMAGFPYHKDIESNGEITAIYSLGEESTFEIRHPERPDQVTRFPLVDNSFILLSGPARWDYEHRVIPVVIQKKTSQLWNEIEAIKRISLVLGIQPKGKDIIKGAQS